MLVTKSTSSSISRQIAGEQLELFSEPPSQMEGEGSPKVQVSSCLCHWGQDEDKTRK